MTAVHRGVPTRSADVNRSTTMGPGAFSQHEAVPVPAARPADRTAVLGGRTSLVAPRPDDRAGEGARVSKVLDLDGLVHA
jgi:hypothetical protein